MCIQIITVVNTDSWNYAQDYPGAVKDVEINGTQLSICQVFSGTVTETFTAKGYDMPAADTFFRLGFIINGDGSAQAVYFDNVIVRPVPEPAALGLFALALPALAARRRRRA